MNNHLYFKEDTHQYFRTEDNAEYTCVSHFISKFYKKFDAKTISKFTAKKQGKTQEQVLAEWDANRDYACTRGTAFHEAMENYLKFGEISPEYKKVIENFQLLIQDIFDDIIKVHSEILLYIDEFMVAGTSDIIWEHKDDSFTVGDFKTNKKFNFYSKYNDWMLKPIEHLSHCEYNKYALQLSIYAFMYEKLTGKKCRGLVLFWLDQKTGKWQRIPVNYLKHEVVMMFNFFKKGKIIS